MGTTIAVLGGLALLALAMTHGDDVRAEEKPARLLRHLVLYKYRDDLTPAEVQEAIDAFVALPSKIDTIVELEHGANVSPEGKSEGLTYGFLVSFKDEAGRDAYLTHPAHLEYVKLAGTRREKVVVFDYWTSK